MDKVYFLKDFNKLEKATFNVLKGFYLKGEKVLVKIHFGEPGNNTAFKPKDIVPVIEAMKILGLKPVLIDTPVVYTSLRNNPVSYRLMAKAKGFGKLAPTIISNKAKKIKMKDFTAGVCKELVEADNVLVVSHVKGHSLAGFGGAIKNLGMGGVTRETKNIEHTLGKTKVIGVCRGCGNCIKFCPRGAIKLVNNKAVFNLKICYGCSICQQKCDYECLAPIKASFDDLLAQGASAVINNFPKKTYYINIMKRITKNCDCCVNSGAIIAKDVGVTFSSNPVAIDKACLDLVKKANKGKDVFYEANHKDPMLQVRYAATYTNMELDYKLVNL